MLGLDREPEPSPIHNSPLVMMSRRTHLKNWGGGMLLRKGYKTVCGVYSKCGSIANFAVWK